MAVRRVARDRSADDEDLLAIEEPLEIRIGEQPLSVTMRTPGDDFELAAGFLLTEGIVRGAGEIESMRHWGSANVVRVSLAADLSLDLQKLKRHFYASSSCGVCGKTSIEAIRVQTSPIGTTPAVDPEVIATLPDTLRRTQPTFDATGGLHAAGLFTPDGRLVRAHEDVGRHNAVDKVIGATLLAGEPFDDRILVVSGRAGFEIVQKAAVAAIPILAAVGAPSSLAVHLARDLGITLIGFLRDGRYNVYASAAARESSAPETTPARS